MAAFLCTLVVSVCLLHQGKTQVLWQKTSMTPGNPLAGFQTTSSGTYGQASFSTVKDPAGGDQEVLRVFYQKGSYSSSSSAHQGGGFYSSPIGHHDALTLSYDIYFSPGFGFNLGGKLPGLYGGIHSCAGGHHSEDCFTTRFMWRTNGEGEVYSYLTTHQASGFCQRSGVQCNADYGDSLGRGKWHYVPGKWHNIAQHVRLNTVGKTDGLIKVWFDNALVFQLDNVAIRSKDTVHIDGFFFNTFFGGHTADWAAPHDCYTYYKNFVLSSGSDHPVIVGK